MKFETCPRCEMRSFERFTDYLICYQCSFNTIEQLAWKDFTLRCPPLAGTEHDPLKDMHRLMKDPPVNSLVDWSDYGTVMHVIKSLPTTHQEVFFLKVWKNYNSMTVSYFLDLKLRLVESYFKDACIRIQHVCIKTPVFEVGELLAA